MNIARGITIAALGATTLVACGGSDSDSAGGSSDSFCDAVKDIEDSDVTPDTDPEAAADMLKNLADQAPSEIKSQLESFSNTLTAVVEEDTEALANVDFDEMQSNIVAIGEYIGNNCDGIDSDVFSL